jgi:hypothetical protein
MNAFQEYIFDLNHLKAGKTRGILHTLQEAREEALRLFKKSNISSNAGHQRGVSWKTNTRGNVSKVVR